LGLRDCRLAREQIGPTLVGGALQDARIPGRGRQRQLALELKRLVDRADGAAKIVPGGGHRGLRGRVLATVVLRVGAQQHERGRREGGGRNWWVLRRWATGAAVFWSRSSVSRMSCCFW